MQVSMPKNSNKPVGVLTFLGTNCDREIHSLLKSENIESKKIWYQDQFDPNDYQAFILPGGFSFGDYLRTGILAARSQAMKSLKEAADKGFPILGICNGFQILCEAHLLPGVLIRNQNLNFIDDWVDLEVQSNETSWTSGFKQNQKIKIPIAHGEGRYYADSETLHELKNNNQIIFTYKNNPNGSVFDIAGITNKNRNVVGLMPHPERAFYNWMGSDDGKGFFKWLS